MSFEMIVEDNENEEEVGSKKVAAGGKQIV